MEAAAVGPVLVAALVVVQLLKQPRKKAKLYGKVEWYWLLYICTLVSQPLLHWVQLVEIGLAVVKLKLHPCNHRPDLLAAHWPHKPDYWRRRLFGFPGLPEFNSVRFEKLSINQEHEILLVDRIRVLPWASWRRCWRRRLCERKQTSGVRGERSREKRGILGHTSFSRAYKQRKGWWSLGFREAPTCVFFPSE